jgi:peptidoglycan hydrolase CwlO-like protein
MFMNLSFKKIAIIFLIGVFGFFNFPVNAADEIEEAQNELEKLENKAENVQKELQQSQGLLQKTTNQVITTQGLIEKTSLEISRKEAEVKNLSDRIELSRKILSEYIRQAYYSNEENLIIKILVEEKNLSGIFGNLTQVLGVKGRILDSLEEIKVSKEELDKAKVELANKKEDHEKLLSIKKSEQTEIQQDVQETQITLAEIQQKISKLRSTLSSFLGESFNADDIIEAIKYASKQTGVRKEFLMAMLDKESDLGRFTGGCTYQNTRVKDADKEEFKRICKELGYDYKKKKISCAGSGGYGGAMGVAQFMPTTWVGYKTAIKSYTGHNPPDPWNLTDGVVGMAEKLKRAGGNKKSGERSAAMIYYCGTSHPTETYRGRVASCNNYANTVISWSKGYDEYFK